MPMEAGLSEEESQAREKRLQETVVRLRANIMKAILALKGGMRMQLESRQRPDEMVSVKIPERANVDRDGYVFAKEDGSDHSVIIAPRQILDTSEGRNLIQTYLADEEFTSDEKAEITRKLLTA